MASKLLSESGWKAVAKDCNIKDQSLQKQLVLLELLDENEYADRLKCLASVILFAKNVKKSKEAAASPDACKYLTGLISAAEAEPSRRGKLLFHRRL